MIQILQELSILCLNTIFMLFFLLINIYHKEIYFTIDSTTLFIKAHIIAKQPIKFLYTTICKSSILFRLLSLILICGLCLCLFFYLTKNFSLIISTILVIADRFYPSSKTCSECGSIKKDLKLKDRVYRCPHCGVVIDRDYNASLNLSMYKLA